MSKYPGQQAVNNALIKENNNGLGAEVHCYQKLMEADEVKQKISVLQAQMANISLDLHPVLQQLSEAKAVKQIEQHRAHMVNTTLIHLWILK